MKISPHRVPCLLVAEPEPYNAVPVMKRNMLTTLVLLPVLCSLSAGLVAQPQANSAKSPKILLFLVIDQARMEYLNRFGPSCTGGLRYLLDHGVVFEQAFHDHAISNTAPGHATLSTGSFPAHSGIVSNEWFDRKSEDFVYCVADSDVRGIPVREGSRGSSGRSPAHLKRSALPDWIRDAHAQSRIFSASRKDRGAILLGGHAATAYWIDTTQAEFVSSSYYLRRYPQWVSDFRRRQIPDQRFGKLWEPLPQVVHADPSLHVVQLDTGVLQRGFPHALGGPTLEPNTAFYSDFSSSPFVDSYLAEFAKALIENEGIGEDETLDYLGLSFSALDLVGHTYGPNSPEVFDTILRLDQALGGLFDFIDKRVGLDRVAMVLSADHGVGPLPEYERPRSGRGTRVGSSEIACLQGVDLRLEEKYGPGPWFSGGLYLDYAKLGRDNLLRQAVEADLKEWIQECPIVERVWTRTEIESAASKDAFLELYRHSFDDERSPDLFIQAREYSAPTPGLGASHGTPWDYDRHVPVIFVVPGTAAKRDSEHRLRTVDVAPTLASLLGIARPDDLDGRDRSAWVH